MSAAGRYFVNGKDFFTLFGVIVESGSDGFLKPPSRKETITRDWADANGLDVDVSRFYFNARDVSLDCALFAENEEQFWERHGSFTAEFTQPGLQRIEIREFGMRSYFVIYKETDKWNRFTRVKVDDQPGGGIKIANKFTITITELEPQVDNRNIFILTQDGRFLIT